MCDLIMATSEISVDKKDVKMPDSDDIDARLDALMVLAKENVDELRVQLKALLEENASLKDELQSGGDLFQIATEPQNEEILSSMSSSTIYDVRTTVLENKSVEEEDDSKPKPEGIVIKNTCFNCGGDHQLPACTEPKDFRKIAMNRREFMSNTNRSARYHVDENQRFGQYQPGLPSEQLRLALGLKENQLPSFIYRMRELGHPPGWLKAAEINHSGMGIYVQKDKMMPEASDEDGEVFDSSDKIQYDFNKLPEWPGFNVEAPENYVEESRKYRVPPMQQDQLKSSLIARLRPKAQKGYVRKEMVADNESKAKKRKTDETPQNGHDTPQPESPIRREVVCVDEGTPIVTLYSPFASLPEQSKWATNTTDHIMFENLPESTGKYENLREILQKIRDKRPNFENGEDEFVE